ncbi:MAG TPA: hypothetical protein DEQ38_07120 [Elusimicrobia bacterium]|nr:MAG: hypothetical protein A2089_07985 [Elusimicrobia bacterium GWD2_63_28]HCC47871.1 hypothetical protein [Elusimicrobiota bacterium]
MKLFKNLVKGGPHVQISFRLAFSEEIKFPRARSAAVLCDSEFNLTLFAEEQVWDKEVDLGRGVASLWTGTSCISGVPGRLHHKPVTDCTKEEFIKEIKTQILGCAGLDDILYSVRAPQLIDSAFIVLILLLIFSLV